jgi:hypothetical protein
MADITSQVELSIALKTSLDVLRKLIRKSPELSKLGKTFGRQRIYTKAEADKVREAYEQRKPRKVKVPS